MSPDNAVDAEHRYLDRLGDSSAACIDAPDLLEKGSSLKSTKEITKDAAIEKHL